MLPEARSLQGESRHAGRDAGRLIGPGALGLLALAGMGLFALGTRRGVALGSDSAAYIAAARSFVEGSGLSWLSGGVEARPLVLHAPLYPLMLAGFEALSVDSVFAARTINGLAFGLSILLFGVLLHRLTRSWGFSLYGALILMCTGELFAVYVWAMSDPWYIAMSLAALVLAVRFLEDGHLSLFVAAAIGASAAYLTRYVGLSLVVGLALAFLLRPRLSPFRRWTQAGIFLVVGVVPIGVWFARNASLTGQIAGRIFGRSGASLPEGGEQAAAIILNWFLPLRLVDWLRERSPLLSLAGMLGIIGLALLVGLSFRSWSTRGPTSRALTGVVIGLYSLAFLGLIGFSYLYSRPGTDLNDRTLSPLYPATLAVVVALLAWLWSSRRAWLRALVLVACVVFLRNKAVYTYGVVDDLMSRGQGYASTAWQESPTIAALMELSPDLVYTDDIAAVYLLANRNVYLVPLRLESVTGRPRSDYEENLERMRQRIDGHQALLVLFQPDSLSSELAPLDDLVAGLAPLAVLDDGVIYGPAGEEASK